MLSFSQREVGFTVDDGKIRAFYHAIAPFTVALLPPDGVHIGTGVLVDWKGWPLIVTAAHNFDGAKPSQMRFVLSPGGTLREGPMTRGDGCELFRGDILPVEDDFLCDDKNDIAAVRLKNRDLGPNAAFTEIDIGMRNIREGSSVILIGFAWDNSFALRGAARAVGVTTQLGRYREGLNAHSGLSSSYNEQEHFLLPYTRTEDGVRPYGISGTAAWCNQDHAGSIWVARPALVGVQTAWFERSKLLKIVRLGPLIDLLSRLA